MSGTGGRLFAVSGSKLYELFLDGTYTELGDVGDDASHSPVQMFPNGNQLAIISAGLFWIDNGAGPVQPHYLGSLYTDIAIGWSGTCITSGIYVIRSTGTAFNLGMKGQAITINAVGYTVGNVTDGDRLQLTTTAGVQPAPVGFTAGANTIAWSTAAPFAQVDVGTTLTFVAASPFSALSPTVVSVDAYGNATLSASPAAAGSTGGTAQQIMGPVLAGSGAYLDSFFVVAPVNTKEMQSSAPLDGTTWDKLDTARKEAYPDNIGALLADHEELYVFGEVKSEVWRADASSTAFPFSRDPAAVMSVGIAAPASATCLVDGVAWIGADLRGSPVAYYAKGYQPVRISTHAIEQVWKTYSTCGDAVAFAYEMDGHFMWQISFPTGDAAWVYDFTASAQMGKPMWHERNSYDQVSGATHRFRGAVYAHSWNKHWVGDFAITGAQRGMVYELSSSVYTDNGQVMTCSRTFPHLCEGRLRQFFSKFQLDLETGGNALTVVLQWSDDGGHTFVGGGSAFTLTGSTTKFLDRLVYWSLGSSDDRTFRLTVTGNARKALINAYLDSNQGIT